MERDRNVKAREEMKCQISLMAVIFKYALICEVMTRHGKGVTLHRWEGKK